MGFSDVPSHPQDQYTMPDASHPVALVPGSHTASVLPGALPHGHGHERVQRGGGCPRPLGGEPCRAIRGEGEGCHGGNPDHGLFDEPFAGTKRLAIRLSPCAEMHPHPPSKAGLPLAVVTGDR